MEPDRTPFGLVFWSSLVAILVVDGFAPARPVASSSWKRVSPLSTQLHSATQTYLDSLSGFGNTVVPPLQSFAETAITLTDDFTMAATTLLAESGVEMELPLIDGSATTTPPVADVIDSMAAAAAPTADAVASTSSVAPPVETIPPNEDLWNLGSTVFESIPEITSNKVAEAPLTNYWDSVVPKTVPSWYESLKETTAAKQEEFLAAVLAQQQKTQASKSLLPKSNPIDGASDTLSSIENPFRGIHPPSAPTLSSLADASLMDILSAMGRSLGTIARGFWYLLTAVVEFLSGGKASLNQITEQIRVSIDQSVHDALEAMRSSLYDLGQVTLQEACTFLLQIVIKFTELLFQLISSLCQALTGRGLDVWLQSIGHGLAEQAVVATSALSTSAHDLSHASLAELAAIMGSYGAAVAKVLIDSPRSLADAFSASGATELLQNTLSSTAVESTTSLLGSGTFP